MRRLLRSAESLPHLGLRWVEYRRRTGPYDLEEQDDDKVWWRLVAGFHHEPGAQKARQNRQCRVLDAARTFVECLAGLPDPDHEIQRLAALVSGSAHEVRMATVEPGECLDLVRKHLLSVVAASHEGGAHGAA
ncbi:MAG: hypothetical protein JWP74_88 [Marmoricola sp.]|nr:hypothetical protein [Marmoricola sp.]